MASYNKTLQLLASKLGLSEEEKVLSKAAEFERLLQTKTISGSNLSDTSKVVICLDLAARIFGVELDMKTAIKYSGLKPVTYSSNRKTVENLLELNTSKLTVPVLCVSLQCSSVQEVAERILEEYRRHSKVELDMSLPQYVCMAVYHACRINKVKVSKVKLNEKCRLKPAQWAKLDADWTKFVDEKFAVTRKRGRPAKNAVQSDENQEMEIDVKDEINAEPEAEPYEEWKRRMLDAAYRELKEKENRLRSPRKTPLKETPNTQKDLSKRTPQKDLSKRTPQKDLFKRTPQKDLFKRTPQKDSFKSTPQRVRDTPQKDLPIRIPDVILGTKEDSPRRSPRKTEQKFSPYKPPKKGNGVRLLFPNCS